MRRKFLLSILGTDLVALAAVLVFASLLVFGEWIPWDAVPRENLWPMLGLLGVGALLGSYASVRMWAQGAPRPSYGRALAIVAIASAFTATGLVLGRPYWSRPYLATTIGLWLGATLLHRFMRRRRPWAEDLVIVTGEKGLVEDLRDAEHTNVVDLYDPAGEPPMQPIDNTTLVVDLRPVMSDRMAQYISSWNLAGYPVRALSSVYEEYTGRLPMVHLAEGWELSAPVRRNEYAAVKRAIDVVLVVATAPLWLLLAAVIWVSVRLDSAGPAIYRQCRMGLDGESFMLYKFRTMVVDAEQNGPQFAAENDSRLTKVGRLLRRFRVDEIPQLLNVLKGDLSLVGPRPERPVFTEQFESTIPFYGYRHLVRPGVTGWAQVNFGYADNERETVEKLTYDLYYVKHMSPWLDLSILGRSMWTVLSGFGAK
ncbi:MAG: exopolysaccharide biosynthesis polyprenyl glycosylphosphotransferase [Actinomycetota bacterium]|nr:exopolysaccharide biosynthesis polyprenyl glycosylphosphotransferase [Actinomycetota bacterium]